MREKFNHLYLDSHERKLLIHSLVELKNQLIQQGRYTDCIDELIFKVINEKYLLLFKARQADAITGCFAEYSRLELKRAKSRQTPIREQLRQAEEQVKKQPQRELTKEAAHGDR